MAIIMNGKNAFTIDTQNPYMPCFDALNISYISCSASIGVLAPVTFFF